MRIGSLCSGYGGLDMGLQLAIGGEVVWHAEYDKDASKILAPHWPDVPNHRDITTVDWTQVEPVDWLTAGYPCQPFSHAGKRQGTNDVRHIWPYVATAIRILRPRNVLLENVAGHLSMGFGDVLGDLAQAGYDAQWCCVRASDVGAPHRRERVFIIASDTHRAAGSQWWQSAPGQTQGRRSRPDVSGPVRTPTPDTAGDRWDEGWPEPAGIIQGFDATERGCSTPADAECGGRHGGAPNPLGGQVKRATATGGGESPGITANADCTGSEARSRRQGTGDAGRLQPMVGGSTDWGTYTPAIRRWEQQTRPAPAPTEPGRNGKPRLSPLFVEWMMGLPAGHVTDVNISRNNQLKALGNGVVPAQAAHAVRLLTAVA